MANMYPTFYTMIPASVLSGIADSTLWSCMPLLNSYFALKYSELNGVSKTADIESRFSGYFYAMVLGAKIPGNLISYVVLYAFNEKTTEYLNVTTFSNTSTLSYLNYSKDALTTTKEFKYCGANDCQDAVIVSETLEQYVPTNKVSIYVLMAILSSLCAVAVVIHIVFIPETGDFGVSRRTLDMQKLNSESKIESPLSGNGNITMQTDEEALTEEKSSSNVIIKDQGYVSFAFSTVKDIGKQVVNFKQILVTPIFIYHGLTYGFVTSELTRSYSSCAFGVAMIPVHSIFYGIGAGIVCFVLGKLGKLISRDWFFFVATLADGSMYVYCLLWTPTSDTSHWSLIPMYFLFGGMQGIWMSNGHVVQVSYFPNRLDVACPVWNLYYMLGIAIQFAWSTSFCVRTKIFIQIVVLIVSMLGYGIAETLHRKQMQQKRTGKIYASSGQ